MKKGIAQITILAALAVMGALMGIFTSRQSQQGSKAEALAHDDKKSNQEVAAEAKQKLQKEYTRADYVRWGKIGAQKAAEARRRKREAKAQQQELLAE